MNVLRNGIYRLVNSVAIPIRLMVLNSGIKFSEYYSFLIDYLSMSMLLFSCAFVVLSRIDVLISID